MTPDDEVQVPVPHDDQGLSDWHLLISVSKAILHKLEERQLVLSGKNSMHVSTIVMTSKQVRRLSADMTR